MMSAHLQLLKESLRQIAPTALLDSKTGESRSSGISRLDAELEAGGLALGTITEISGAASSGKTAVALTAAAALHQSDHSRTLCGFIDGRNEFYPPAAAALGVDLPRLLWVRPGSPITSIARATEILIRSRAFALLIIDLPRGSRLARSLAQRLRTSASQTSTSLIALCDRAGDVEQAHTRLQATRHRGQTSLLVHKGSASGGPKTIAARFERRRASAPLAPPIAPAIDRTPPGHEPPGARIPSPPAFPLSQPLPQQGVL